MVSFDMTMDGRKQRVVGRRYKTLAAYSCHSGTTQKFPLVVFSAIDLHFILYLTIASLFLFFFTLCIK